MPWGASSGPEAVTHGSRTAGCPLREGSGPLGPRAGILMSGLDVGLPRGGGCQDRRRPGIWRARMGAERMGTKTDSSSCPF
eukprot:1584732-Pyramimonas_sp.AAC.1